MAGTPISAGGYTTYGLDYRGHGLSDGNRGDAPGKERLIADLTEFLIMKNATHARILPENWQEVVAWLDKHFPK